MKGDILNKIHGLLLKKTIYSQLIKILSTKTTLKSMLKLILKFPHFSY